MARCLFLLLAAAISNPALTLAAPLLSSSSPVHNSPRDQQLQQHIHTARSTPQLHRRAAINRVGLTAIATVAGLIALISLVLLCCCFDATRRELAKPPFKRKNPQHWYVRSMATVFRAFGWKDKHASGQLPEKLPRDPKKDVEMFMAHPAVRLAQYGDHRQESFSYYSLSDGSSLQNHKPDNQRALPPTVQKKQRWAPFQSLSALFSHKPSCPLSSTATSNRPLYERLNSTTTSRNHTPKPSISISHNSSNNNNSSNTKIHWPPHPAVSPPLRSPPPTHGSQHAEHAASIQALVSIPSLASAATKPTPSTRPNSNPKSYPIPITTTKPTAATHHRLTSPFVLNPSAAPATPDDDDSDSDSDDGDEGRREFNLMPAWTSTFTAPGDPLLASNPAPNFSSASDHHARTQPHAPVPAKIDINTDIPNASYVPPPPPPLPMSRVPSPPPALSLSPTLPLYQQQSLPPTIPLPLPPSSLPPPSLSQPPSLPHSLSHPPSLPPSMPLPLPPSSSPPRQKRQQQRHQRPPSSEKLVPCELDAGRDVLTPEGDRARRLRLEMIR